MMRSLIELSDRSMPGMERHAVGSWVCRAANGATSRANSCTPFGESSHEVDDSVDEVERWFRERDLRPLFQIWDGCDPNVVEELNGRGYEVADGAEVLTLQLDTSESLEVPVPTEILDRPDGQLEGIGVSGRLEELAMSSLPKLVASTVRGSGGAPDSSGVGVIDGAALGIFAMRTGSTSQRKGLASAVLASLLVAGVARGATMAWLQVVPTNKAASQLYQGFGFEVAARYHYLTQV